MKKIEACKTQHLQVGKHRKSNRNTAAVTLSSAGNSSALCEHNNICRLLGLSTLELEPPDDDDDPATTGEKLKYLNIDFLVHDDNVDPKGST